ncbi:MAG TPA: hypothetical protein VH637_17815 [Streptosporangiaceae bacterium]|jgi:hypothetical protein
MTHFTRRIMVPVITIAVLGAGLLLAGCGAPAALHARSVSAVTSTITIDPGVGETFGAAPPDAAPTLTPQQAWAAGAQNDSGDVSAAIPPDVTMQLGVLTLPIGPTGPEGAETYAAQDELAYGFSWSNCPVSRNPDMQALPDNPCIEWEFIDANTGQQIDDTWQQ